MGAGGGQTPKQVSPSELAANSLQQASAMNPKKAAAKAGREIIWEHVLLLKILFF